MTMKVVVIMRIPAHILPDGADGLFRDTGCKSNVTSIDDYTILDVHEVIVWLKFDAGDSVVALVRSYLDKHGVKEFGGEVIEYSDEDLQSARLLSMTPDINESVFAGPRLGTKYDMSQACATCGAGARQISALYVKADNLRMIRKHRAIGSYYDDIIVDGGIQKKLVDAGATGISFGEVRARLKNEKWSMVARDQVLIAHTMPPRRFEHTMSEDKYLCKVCRRGGVVNVPMTSYRSEDLVGMQDFNLTWEWFGVFKFNGKVDEALFPSPGVLVTPKVMNIFREASVTTFKWTPVSIDE